MAALAESTTRHAVFVERLKSGQVAKFAPFLREIDRRLREALTRGGLTAFQRDRLTSLLAEIDAMLGDVLGRYTGQLRLDLREFAAYEAQFAGRTLEQTGIAASVPTAGQVAAAAFAAPLQVQGAGGGKLLDTFIADWSRTEREVVTGAIRVGVAQGRTTAEIVTEIRGTKARNYADGLLAVTKRHAAAVTRTAVQHVGDLARLETYKANADIIKGEQWSATLDSRTTAICQSLDGRVFPLDKGPRPPAHINCRSVRIPVLADEFAFLTKGEKRSSVDGPVDARLTYFDWLKQQPASFQDEAIGPTRGLLLRNGGLSADRFAALQLDRNFKPLTLEEMKQLEPLAFKRAGLD
jgi:SPP1 gp7 family putative phage head morphogenesis protein